MYRLAGLYLIASGIAALTYQVTWVRLLGLSMGSTSASVSTVLAAFFLGLSLGSLLAPKLTQSRVDSLKAYLWLEVAMGVSGLVLLPILANLDHLMAMVPELGRAVPTKFAITLALLAVPTICMGATFPVMATLLVRRSADIGQGLGELYSLNTLGAALGAALAGFLFIPNVGLDGAIFIAAGINFCIAISGALLSNRLTLPPLETNADAQAAPARPGNFAALAVLATTGAASIATEVAWTKYLGIFTGTTVFGFAAMLAIFLIGIAAGAWAIRRHIKKIQAPMVWLALGLSLTCAALFYTLSGLTYLPSIYDYFAASTDSLLLREWLKYAIIFCLLFPATFLFGALFPLNLALYCGPLDGLRSSVGRAYAINTLASITGSVAAGFFLIPQFGTHNVLSGAAWLLLAPAALLLLQKMTPKQRAAIVSVMAVTSVAASQAPTLDYKNFIASVRYEFDKDAAKGKPNFLFLQEGRVSVITMVSYDGKLAKLQANGLNESVIDMVDPYNALPAESMLAYMPYFLHANPKSAFVLGYGGGITTQAFTQTDVESIRVVELEPAVVAAGRSLPHGPTDALNDPRVRLDFDDARMTLLLEKTKYDIIASQPSHPWLAGAANVFTQEFFEIVRSRLNQDGIYSQWINLFRMDATTLKSLMRSFYAVFPYGMAIAEIETGDLVLMGSQQALQFDVKRIEPRIKRDAIARTLAHKEIYSAMDLIWYFSLSRDQVVKLAANAEPNTDMNILSEIRLSALRDVPSDEEDPYRLIRKNYSFDFDGYVAKESLAITLADAGKRFVDWYYPRVARMVLPRLEALDPRLGRELRHHTLWQEHNYPAAEQLFSSNQEWSDESRLRQGFIQIDSGNIDKAQAQIASIVDPAIRSKLTARLLEAEGDWLALTKLETTDPIAKKWRQLGASMLNPAQGGKDLAASAKTKDENEAIIKAVIGYYAAIGDKTNQKIWAERLATQRLHRKGALVELADQAVTQKDLPWTESVLAAIVAFDANAAELPRLRAAIAKLQAPQDKN